jgi:hypothetical protein
MRGEPHKNEALFRLLLLSMFSLATRHSPRFVDPHGTAGYPFFDQAKTILSTLLKDIRLFYRLTISLDCTYHISHPTTCQSILLLALREFGMGAMGQAWLYVGESEFKFGNVEGQSLTTNRHGYSDGSRFGDASIA